MDSISKLIIGVFVSLMIALPIASAFAITTYYWEPDKPLIIKPGDSTDVFFQLQNMVSNEDMAVKATLSSGSEIAEIADDSDIYIVPAGKKDVNINIKVSVPKSDPIGKGYTIGLAVKEIKDTGKGMVEFSTSVGSSIPVLVSDTTSPPEDIAGQSQEESNLVPFLVGGLLLLSLIIAGAILRKRKKDK